ncbi:MAG TPA: glycosyltransferase family 9 protein [Terriglobales bacterium]|jgi:heptosyltransferase-1|nr:glycosyltransferase family 9 protein [Terriglobales bacterium]
MAVALSPSSPPVQGLLVVRLSAMGDIIHTLPAVSALREAFPHATLGWVVEERWSELLCAAGTPRSGPRSPQRPLADRVHIVNTKQWRRALLSAKTWQEMSAVSKEVRAIGYQTAIDFQGALRTALLARWSGARTVYGDANPREPGAQLFYSRPVATSGVHVVEQALSLAQAVTPHPVTAARALFPVDPGAEDRITALVGDARDFTILNPGAGWGAKQWPAERYGLVASELAKDGVRSLINYGPGEGELAAAVETASAGAARKISCSISELIALTRRARLFVGGDTGPMHLAAALQVPVVAIFGPTNPARNGPFGTASIVLRSASSMTSHARHREPEKGLLEISPEEVIAAARKLLGSRHE